MTRGQLIAIFRIEREQGVKYNPATDTPESFLAYYTRHKASKSFTQPAVVWRHKRPKKDKRSNHED